MNTPHLLSLATLDDSAPRWFVEFADLRAVLEAA